MPGTRERNLPGGRTFGAVRVGDTVRRPVQPWTPAVRAVLRFLDDAGFAGAPRPLGVDERGREVLTYLPGRTVGERRPWPGWVHDDETLVQVAAWLRRLHDLTRSFVPPPDTVWLAGQGWQPGLVIGHNDAAPYNAVWDDGALRGFVDWDTAGPSSPATDLAFAALWWVPLHARHVVEQVGFTAFDDRRRRLHLFLDAYGWTTGRAEFGAAVAGRARRNAAVLRRLAAGGDPVYTALLPTVADLEAAAVQVEALPASFWR